MQDTNIRNENYKRAVISPSLGLTFLYDQTYFYSTETKV